MKYRIQKNDSLIKICRKFGLNSIDELLELNPQIDDPNKIIVGQYINLPDSVDSDYGGTLQPAVFTEQKGSTDYFQMSPEEQARASAYYLAYKNHQITFDQVPEQYKSAIFKMRTTDHDKVAAALINYMNPLMYLDRLTRGTAAHLLHPKDYSWIDVWGPEADYSVLSRENRDEHPIVAFVGDLLASAGLNSAVGSLATRGLSSWRTLFSRAAATAEDMGVSRISVKPAETPLPGRTTGAKFQGSATAKGFGKTGTVTKNTGRAGFGYEANSSPKAAYHHEYHGTGNGRVKFVEAQYGPDEASGVVVPPAYPVSAGDDGQVQVVFIPREDFHIETTRVFNPWIYSTYTGPTVPYIYGNENPEYEEGEAPRGNTTEEQPIRGVERKKGRARASASIESGSAKDGENSGYYSSYGVNGSTDPTWHYGMR